LPELMVNYVARSVWLIVSVVRWLHVKFPKMMRYFTCAMIVPVNFLLYVADVMDLAYHQWAQLILGSVLYVMDGESRVE